MSIPKPLLILATIIITILVTPFIVVWALTNQKGN